MEGGGADGSGGGGQSQRVHSHEGSGGVENADADAAVAAAAASDPIAGVDIMSAAGAIVSDDAIRTVGKKMSKKQRREQAKRVALRVQRLRTDLHHQPIREECGAEQK